MPSKSIKQHNFMEMIAHSPKMAKKADVPQSVGKEFAAADKGKKFKLGSEMAKKPNLKSMFKGKDTKGEELKEAKAIKSGKITPMQYAKGEKMEPVKKFKERGLIGANDVKETTTPTKKDKTKDVDTQNKERFDKQVKSAKAGMSAFDVDPYLKSEAPTKKSMFKTKDPNYRKGKGNWYAEDPYRGVNDLDVGEPTIVKKTPEKKHTVVKAAPRVKSRFERMQDAYEDLGYAKEYKDRPASTRFAISEKPPAGAGTDFAKAFSSPESSALKAQWGNEGESISPFAKGGAVKSSAASRGDGCAQRGKTRGRFI